MTVPLAKDGEITQWVLVDKNLSLNYHVEFSPSSRAVSVRESSAAMSIFMKDLVKLCKQDKALALKMMAASCLSSKKTCFMIVSDHNHMLWHHIKEEFVTKILFKTQSQVKDAIVRESGNHI
ncbi:hypothetical protein GX50_02651 [[Emmonsia] crescens]|uniref:LYC1 C-terminal domain-containing protein n=1 Tax=[Emmonsia] crescens TaxID=73230 RepID=A0A2B7ZN02_9EURO|nr:hypothetical protein GX50_02651 [Emmonsia crescens]